MLGVDNLQALLLSEKSQPPIFSKKYYSLLHEVSLLESINIEGLKIDSYDYLIIPTLPESRDGPKKTVTIFLSMLLGFMLGAAVVLVRDSYRAYNLSDR